MKSLWAHKIIVLILESGENLEVNANMISAEIRDNLYFTCIRYETMSSYIDSPKVYIVKIISTVRDIND